jgi:Ca2+-binding EF-hand superfamily protein
LKDNPFFDRKIVQKNFDSFFQDVDKGKDGKIDRYELYEYCIDNLKPE